MQENDKALVGKIGSTMANTIPLWRQQLAMAVTIARLRRSRRYVKAGNRFDERTVDRKRRHAAHVDAGDPHADRARCGRHRRRQAGKRRADRDHIDDALRIADDGKRQRVEAEKTLVACEAELNRRSVRRSHAHPNPLVRSTCPRIS